MSDHIEMCSDLSHLSLVHGGGFGTISPEERRGKVPETYDFGGGKMSYHGISYQARLLMYFLLRGMSIQYSFSLATDMKDADKFDDLILRYKRGSGGPLVFRMVQAKHRATKGSKITLQSLLEEKGKGEFSLRKYFRSFLILKNKFTGEDKEIRDLIICTNADFKYSGAQGGFKFGSDVFEVRKNELGEDVDEIFETKLMCFKKDFEGRKFLVDFLRGTASENTFGEAEIESFLSKLSFAMNQLGNDELKEKMMEVIRAKYCIRDSEDVFTLFQGEIFQWMIKLEGTYFTVEDGRAFFKRMTNRYGSFNFGYIRPVANFTGRVQELKDMRAAHENDRVIVVSGLGGIGKTELVRKYIDQNSDRFHRMIWINAESQESLISSFRRLAFERLNINPMDSTGKERKTESILEELYDWFSEGNSVLVFDNVECSYQGTGDDAYIKMFLPQSAKKPFVLLTSRYELWDDFKVIPIGAITESDAAEFIRNSLNITSGIDEETIRTLTRTLQCFPLALQQAVAYMKVFEGQCSLRDYLSKYEWETRRLLEFRHVNGFNSYTSSTFTTWNITLLAFKNHRLGKRTCEMLRLISYFSPEDILIEDIKKYFNKTNDDELKASLSLLKQYSMISIKNQRVSIHKLLQQVTRISIEEDEEEKILTWVVEKSHGIAVEHMISAWEIMIKKENFVDQACKLQNQIIERFIRLVRYEEGYFFGAKCVSFAREKFSGDDYRLLVTLFNYAKVVHLQGKFKESLLILVEVYEKMRHSLGEDHENVLSTKKEIAYVYKRLGQYRKALSMFEEVLEKKKCILGEDHGSVLSTKHHIASVYKELGNYNKALSIFEEVLEKKKHSLGEDHISVLFTRFEIASVYQSLGEYRRALLILEEVYKKEKHSLGEDHVSVLSTRYEIASVYERLGEYRKALSILEEVYEKKKRFLGEDHPSVLTARFKIASVYKILGEYKRAQSLFELVYEKMKSSLGENHLSALTTRHEIASIYESLGEYSRALLIFEDVYRKKKISLGENHVSVLVTRNEIASVYKKLGEYKTALSIFEEVYEKEKLTLGEEHVSALATRYGIASVYERLGEYKKALSIMNELYEKKRNCLGENHHSVLTLRFKIATAYKGLGEYKKALSLLEEVHEKKVYLGEDHPSVLSVRFQIATVYKGLGDIKKALSILEEVYEKRKNSFGEDHVSVLITKQEIDSIRGEGK